MVHLIVSELGYYKAAQTLNNLHDSLFKDILDETVEKFSSYLDNLVRGV